MVRVHRGSHFKRFRGVGMGNEPKKISRESARELLEQLRDLKIYFSWHVPDGHGGSVYLDVDEILGAIFSAHPREVLKAAVDGREATRQDLH